MSAMMPLDPMQLPLRDIQLIEASAGTGKTWTLAALYLRLVLGHGGQPPLLPAQILVVTYTRVATAELRERIRERLAGAAAAFRGQQDADAFLQRLIDAYPDANQRAVAARQLELAARWMDEAAIYTIHGWCQRMLTQHAFEGSDTPDAVADETARLAEAVRDYWRSFYAPLDRDDAAKIKAWWIEPKSLQRAVQPLLSQSLEQLRVAGQPLPDTGADLSNAIHHHFAPRREAEAIARAQWRADIDAIESMLLEAVDKKVLKNNIYRLDTVKRQLAELRAWSQGAEIDQETLDRYIPKKLIASTSKSNTPPDHPAFAHIQSLLDTLENEPPLAPLLLAHALPWLNQRIEQIRRRQASLGFDDMLRQLDAALSGAHAASLADTIATQYPLALIDEFQDTDPLQWRIFQRIYANRPETGLLLIGDPKQAIYGFRGADIHTYLRARDMAQSPTWTLATNFRSTAALVAAVNRVFEHADGHPHGAFAFGHGEHGLPFSPVQANGLHTSLQCHGSTLPAMQIDVLSDTVALGSQAYMEIAAGHAATRIVTLLDGSCAFVDAEASKLLRPRDIAVLVRDKNEAGHMREALQQRGIASVYVSDRDSVYDTAEADDVRRWLQACAMPDSDRAMRAALASPGMARTLSELDQLNHDETAWEQYGEQFRQLHATWQRHGVLAMLHNLLHAFDLPARLLAKPNGERRLTNLQHLAELLQHAATTLDGEHALIRYLIAQITEAREHETNAAEEQIVRLESEADLVKVVTIHKSKGLQYPVVMLPFICRFKDASKHARPPWHDDQGQTWVDLQPDDETSARMDRERLQEELRLLYVALTRAEHACWLGVAATRFGNGKESVLPRTAFGYVLTGGESVEPGELAARLHALQANVDGIQVRIVNEPANAQPYHAPHETPALHAARIYRQSAPEPWWIASYSALAHGASDNTRATAPDTATQDVLTEAGQESVEWIAAESEQGIHAFPRGAEPGTFLHDLFEWVAEAGFAKVATDATALGELIARRCQRRGWQAWIAPLTQWLPALLNTPLSLPDGSMLTLGQLNERRRYQAEMEFWFEANHVDTQQLDKLVTRFTLDAMPRASLAPHRMHGMFKGFIDLIVEHDGRYYVIDYKSNWLGNTAGAYSPAAMRDSVLHSRYDLQYALYTLALHRQLRARLPNYDYGRHVGGVLYLYLRGIDHAGHGVHTERLPFALIDAMDHLFAEGTHAHVA